MLNKVCECFESDEWQVQLKFVSWFADWLCRVLQWIGGCDLSSRYGNLHISG
jgi:hypothetical protein